ncbi:MAG: alkaline phosphatase, partial [Pseudomonadota bacterium]
MGRLLGLTSVLAIAATGVAAEKNFNRIASFPVMLNHAEDMRDQESSPEIIDVTADGMTLVYTDSPAEGVGMVDITDAANPAPAGFVKLGGEPTAVAISGTTAFVGVNTSEDYINTSGQLKALAVPSGEELASCELGGQPDSVATNGEFVAVAIENERDEDLGDGRTGQMPAGFLVMVDIADGSLDCDSLRTVELTGLADVDGDDPEPEFVDINGLGEVVVSLQENNHMVVVAADGTIVS